MSPFAWVIGIDALTGATWSRLNKPRCSELTWDKRVLLYILIYLHIYCMRSKQTEKIGTTKSAWQCEQRQGTACFRKQTVNRARWIFHCRAVLMRGSRGVLPRDCIVILWAVPPSTAWSRETSKSLAPSPTCPGQSDGDPCLGYLENSDSTSACSLLYERMSDNTLRYTYDSKATLPNVTFSWCQLHLRFFLFHKFVELIQNKNKCTVQSKVSDIWDLLTITGKQLEEIAKDDWNFCRNWKIFYNLCLGTN